MRAFPVFSEPLECRKRKVFPAASSCPIQMFIIADEPATSWYQRVPTASPSQAAGILMEYARREGEGVPNVLSWSLGRFSHDRPGPAAKR